MTVPEFPYFSYTTAATQYLYDEFALTDRGSVLQQAAGFGPSYTTRSNLTTVLRYLISEDRWIDVSRAYYDTVGNPVEKKDALNRTVETIQYSPTFHYAYPTQVTNALGHSAQTHYGFWSGLPVSTTDANNQTTTFQYDAMNRTSRVDAPNGAWQTASYNDTYFNGAYRTSVATARSIDATHATSETSYYDGLGRLLRSERSEGGGVVSRVDREYALCSCTGKTARVSMPYRPVVGNRGRWLGS